MLYSISSLNPGTTTLTRQLFEKIWHPKSMCWNDYKRDNTSANCASERIRHQAPRQNAHATGYGSKTIRFTPKTRSAQRSACAPLRRVATQTRQVRVERAVLPSARQSARSQHRAAVARPGESRPNRGGSAAYGGAASPEAARP